MRAEPCGSVSRRAFFVRIFGAGAHLAHEARHVCGRCAIIAGMRNKPGNKGKDDVNRTDAYTAVRVVRAAVLSADPASELPTRLKVLGWGANPNANGKKVIVGDKFATALAAETYPFKKLPIDFEHNTVPGTPAYLESKEPRKVAGYATVEAIPGEGVFLNVVRWTPEGRACASSFEDLSACPLCDDDGDVVALPSVALCRTGAVPGIEFVQSPLSAWPQLAAIAPEEKNITTKETDMDYKKILIGLLKLDETATDADIEKAIAVLDALPDKKADPPAAEPLSADVTKRLDDMEKENLLFGARVEGKVVTLSADILARITPAELKEHIAALPVTVPLAQRTPDVVSETAAAVPLTAEREAIARNCGLDPAEVFGNKEKKE